MLPQQNIARLVSLLLLIITGLGVRRSTKKKKDCDFWKKMDVAMFTSPVLALASGSECAEGTQSQAINCSAASPPINSLLAIHSLFILAFHPFSLVFFFVFFTLPPSSFLQILLRFVFALLLLLLVPLLYFVDCKLNTKFQSISIRNLCLISQRYQVQLTLETALPLHSCPADKTNDQSRNQTLTRSIQNETIRMGFLIQLVNNITWEFLSPTPCWASYSALI